MKMRIPTTIFNKRFFSAIALIFWISWLSFDGALAQDTIVPGIVTEHSPEGDILWSWFSHVPENMDKSIPAHIVVMVEGGGDYNDNLAAVRSTLGWKSSLDKVNNFILLGVPIPRSEVYTVAFDKRCFLDATNSFHRRPDIQVNLIIDDLTASLRQNGYNIHDKVFVEGFSNAAMFAQRYCLLHPERIQAIAAGQCGGYLTMPLAQYNGTELPYAIGISDLEALSGVEFNNEAYMKVPQFIYIGDQDRGDEINGHSHFLYPDDAGFWSEGQIDFINNIFGDTDPVRVESQCNYLKNLGYNIFFKSYPGIAHDYTFDMIYDSYEFFEKFKEKSTIAGDLDSNWKVDLFDLVGALRILIGNEGDEVVNLAADVNGDQRLGMGEAIYILRKIAETEPSGETLVKSPAAYESNPTYSDSELQALVDGFSQFTFDFYHALANQPSNSGKNLFFSTYSIENALAMTWAGAQNQTASQMAETLHFNLPQARFHPTLNALNIDLNSRDDQPPPSGDAFALNLVNAVWSRIGYPFLAPYLDTIATNYNAGIRTLDFVNYPEASRLTINQWVADQTYDKIQNLLPHGSISPSTALVLTNAIYFKGSWHEKFDARYTKPGPFTRLDGTTVAADMMHQVMGSQALVSDDFDAVELPYVSTRFPESFYPQELSMLVIIPHAGRFNAVESALDKSRVDALVSSLSSHMVDLRFPKFQFESEAKCKGILQGLGMTDAFVPMTADFNAMVDPSDSRPWIDEVYHKAFVAVDETGTEAAAATAVLGVTATPYIVDISADRPFIFLIRDNITQTILFMGRVLDPTA